LQDIQAGKIKGTSGADIAAAANDLEGIAATGQALLRGSDQESVQGAMKLWGSSQRLGKGSKLKTGGLPWGGQDAVTKEKDEELAKQQRKSGEEQSKATAEYIASMKLNTSRMTAEGGWAANLGKNADDLAAKFFVLSGASDLVIAKLMADAKKSVIGKDMKGASGDPQDKVSAPNNRPPPKPIRREQ
jgi:hypothetical protein